LQDFYNVLALFALIFIYGIGFSISRPFHWLHYTSIR
jgi:hypothetical protein